MGIFGAPDNVLSLKSCTSSDFRTLFFLIAAHRAFVALRRSLDRLGWVGDLHVWASRQSLGDSQGGFSLGLVGVMLPAIQ